MTPQLMDAHSGCAVPQSAHARFASSCRYSCVMGEEMSFGMAPLPSLLNFLCVSRRREMPLRRAAPHSSSSTRLCAWMAHVSFTERISSDGLDFSVNIWSQLSGTDACGMGSVDPSGLHTRTVHSNRSSVFSGWLSFQLRYSDTNPSSTTIHRVFLDTSTYPCFSFSRSRFRLCACSSLMRTDENTLASYFCASSSFSNSFVRSRMLVLMDSRNSNPFLKKLRFAKTYPVIHAFMLYHFLAMTSRSCVRYWNCSS
mmetsp:Transcript_23426/g.58601  ORF Transcript_23426/g.58601 Transcript_23426/m.58601 type:complete len:255 (-) Transcript_23426:631-1395(-)